MIKTFYKGEEGVQYFIKPLKFISNNKNELLLDFTIGVKNDTIRKIVSNFSISNNDLKVIVINDVKVPLEKLFEEYENKRTFSRYTSEFSFECLKDVFTGKVIYVGREVYRLKKSQNKKSNKIKETLISSLDISN